MKSFLWDKDGITTRDFEKFITGFSYLATILVALFVYIMKLHLDPNMVYLVTATGGLFVIRKVASYNKPQAYYDAEQAEKEASRPDPLPIPAPVTIEPRIRDHDA